MRQPPPPRAPLLLTDGARWLTPERRSLAESLVAGVYSQGALVVTGVIVARALGPTDRGHLAFVLVLEAVVRQVGSLGLPSAATYFVARYRDREPDVLRTLRGPAVLQAVTLTAVQALLVSVLVSGSPIRVVVAALLTLPLLPGTLAQQYGLAILQGQGRYRPFNVLRVLPVTAYAVLITLLFAAGVAELVEITAAWVGANVAAGVLTLTTALKGRRPSTGDRTPPSRTVMFRYGARGYLSSLSPIDTFRLDQALIGLFLSAHELGLYVVALSLTNLPQILAQSIAVMAFPQIARDSRATSQRTTWRFFYLTVALTGAAVIALEIAAGRLVPFFFGADFEDAVHLTRVLMLGAFFFGIRRVLSEAAKGSGLPGLGSVAEVTSWLAVIPLMAILLPTHGVEGVAAAMAASAAIALGVLVIMLLRPGSRSRPGVPLADAGPPEAPA